MCRPSCESRTLLGRRRATGAVQSGMPGSLRDVSGREPDREFWSQWRHLAADLLSIVDGHLRSVQRIEAIAGNPYPYDGRPAIERHPQNFDTRSADFLVDAARDLWEILYADLPDAAIGYLDSWAAAPWPVLNRLAIHGWCERCNITTDEKLTWLLNARAGSMTQAAPRADALDRRDRPTGV